ncbi:VanZ family protein [Blastococcus sp. PRF04-17]|uniref:VanZ family protein n=1 Tax=Blastococcus sp. PRF04-17 TaxID=2933797 RepID=UPI001FF0E553|nr:VanZ family protein [Blastococcus sp. PRF04-17]UOY01586.1 VanZ family protein [Blastococcus sp. PRF04-17]
MPVREAMQEHGPLSRGAFAVVVLLSLAVLFAPADDVPSAPPGVDKVVHVALFAALALTGRWAGIEAKALGAGLVCYAALSEVLQSVTPLQRSGSVADWLADVVGVLVGLLCWQWLARRHGRSQDRLA